MSARHYKVETYEARNSVGYLVKRSYALMLDSLEPAFAEHGFTYMQYVLLMQLRSGAALNLRDICHQFRHDSGALTRVVDQLAERGLVERKRCARDRRKVDLRLSTLPGTNGEKIVVRILDRATVSFDLDTLGSGDKIESAIVPDIKGQLPEVSESVSLLSYLPPETIVENLDSGETAEQVIENYGLRTSLRDVLAVYDYAKKQRVTSPV